MKKNRYLDHIDLRVSDLKQAQKFYSKLLPALGFVRDRSSGRMGCFYAAGGDKPEAFFCFTQDRRHRPNKTRIAFWAENRAEVDRLARLARRLGPKILRSRNFVAVTAPVTTPASLTIRMAINWRSATGKNRSSPGKSRELLLLCSQRSVVIG
jgi:catechol 2,3-dioxygenase-like lactoylglutathione lyase family enzyme